MAFAGRLFRLCACDHLLSRYYTVLYAGTESIICDSFLGYGILCHRVMESAHGYPVWCCCVPFRRGVVSYVSVRSLQPILSDYVLYDVLFDGSAEKEEGGVGSMFGCAAAVGDHMQGVPRCSGLDFVYTLHVPILDLSQVILGRAGRLIIDFFNHRALCIWYCCTLCTVLDIGE